MRWLFLINLLAVVLLSGAVAIVIEGTLVGTAPSTTEDSATPEPISPASVARIPLDVGAGDLTDGNEAVAELGRAPQDQQADGVLDSADWVAAPDAPIPLPAPRAVEAADLAPDVTIAAPQSETATDAEPIHRTQLQPLTVATEGDFAPFNFIDAAGNPAGFDIDVAKELCSRLDRECRYEVLPWADLVPTLTRGDIDLVAASMRIPSTSPDGVLFSDPYYGSRGRFVTSNDAGLSGPGLLQTAGAQIAVQEGSLHEAYLKVQYTAVERVKTRSLQEALRHVAEGKVEAAFGDNAAILQWLRDEPCCMALGNPISDETYFGAGIGLVVRDEDKELLGKINLHLRSMLEDGTSASLSEQYFGGSIY